jgi:hypothetical protein
MDTNTGGRARGVAEDGADAERIDVPTGNLRRELLERVMYVVPPAPGGPARAARAVDPAMVAGLLRRRALAP